MNQDYLINLTLAVYRISESWDDSNFLKFKIKSGAAEILKDFLKKNENNSINETCQSQLLKKIAVFQENIVQARAEKLISRNGFLFFKKEYDNLKQDVKNFFIFEKIEKPEKLSFKPTIKSVVKQEKHKEKISVSPGLRFNQDLNQRQQEILKILQEKQKAQVWELTPFFPKVSKRTLRRDLDDLLKKKLVQRQGEWNRIFYEPVIDGTDGRTQNKL
jgi:predicted HTH transcriptional regulator